MPFFIIRDDITNVKVDAIVNPTNHRMIGTGATDGLVHAVAGPGMDEECAKIGGCDTGDVRVTGGYNLPAKYVIHTVGPKWRGGHDGEPILLESCYRRALQAAEELNCESIAFPLISTGTYGYPKNEAKNLAEKTVRSFLNDSDSDMTVYLVTYDREVADGRYRGDLSREIARVLEPAGGEYDPFYQQFLHEITERAADRKGAYGAAPSDILASRTFRREERPEEHLANKKKRTEIDDICDLAFEEADIVVPHYDAAFMAPEDLKQEVGDAVRCLDESFSVMVYRKIEEKGMKPSECYKKANIDRKLFSKISNNINYQPSKATAAAFAVALELDINETKELLEKAGFAFSGSNKFDIIVRYFIEHGVYDVYTINDYLFEFDQPLLGNIKMN